MANDLIARQLAKQVSLDISELDSTNIAGLGTAATKNTGVGVGEIPLTDANGKILIDVIPSSIASGQLYKGLWDASVGTFPAATDAGEFYIVSVAGTIALVTYSKNDQIVWNGSTFDHVDNSQLVTFAEDIKRIGFVDRTSTDVPYLSGAAMDVINLDDAGAGWSYYLNGDKYTISGNKTVELTGGAGNAHSDGVYWVVITTGDGSLSVSQSDPDFGTEVLVAYLYWDSSLTVGSQSLIADERHTILWDSSVHESFHETVGATMESDITISTYQLDSVSDAHKQYSLSSGHIHDEDIILNISALVGGNGVYTNFYRTSAGVWGWESGVNFPFRYAANGRMIYDTVDGGTECSNDKFINTYCVVSNLSGAARFITFTSQTEYDTETLARQELATDIVPTGLFINELICTHRITWNTNDLFVPSTGKCKIVYVKEVMNNYLGLKKIYKLKTNEVYPSTDRNYITDAQLTVVGNTSGANTGDETGASIVSALGYTPVESNSAIVSATKTKITYDTKGLVTVGADATTADIADSSDKRYVTDAQLVVIGNTSGANTGDETSSSIVAALTYTPVESNSAITGATKTKITYDTKGLVTSGADATTADIADSTDKRYVTEALKTAITHSNRANLDEINQDLGTTDNVSFNNITLTGYPIISVGTTTATTTAVNNFVIPTTEVVKITSSTGNFTISGIAGGVSGRKLILYNATGNRMSITDDDGNSSAANRILTMSGSINGNRQNNVTMFYDGSQSRWVVISYLT